MKRLVEMIRDRWISLMILIMLLIITFGLVPFSWHFPTMKGITADFSTDGQHLLIQNGNDFIWERTTITINEEYQYHVEMFPRGGTTIPLREFVNSQGSAFRADQQSLRAVRIHVPHIHTGEPGVLEW